MSQSFRECDLEAYLDEELPVEAMARVEQALRSDAALARHLAAIHARRDSGVHSLGEIWRRHRLSCPTRQQLGSLLLEALPDDLAAYVRFHLETVGCRYCQANLADLQQQQSERREAAQTRQRRYFQSSAGLIRAGTKDPPVKGSE